MGQVIRIRPEEIMPSELGVRLDNIKGILTREKLGIPGVPAPFKKSEYRDGIYNALDSGNSRIVRLLMLGIEKIPIYVAESDEDIMLASNFPGTTDFALYRSNCAIQDRWVECDKNAEVITSFSGVENYKDYFEKLLDSYPYLKSTQDFWKYISTTKGRETFRSTVGKYLDLLVAN